MQTWNQPLLPCLLQQKYIWAELTVPAVLNHGPCVSTVGAYSTSPSFQAGYAQQWYVRLGKPRLVLCPHHVDDWNIDHTSNSNSRLTYCPPQHSFTNDTLQLLHPAQETKHMPCVLVRLTFCDASWRFLRMRGLGRSIQGTAANDTSSRNIWSNRHVHDSSGWSNGPC